MVLVASLAVMAIATMVSACLPQKDTNGNSFLGTRDAPEYGAFMTDNPLPKGYPWGGATARKTNPDMETPKTGVTRYYDFTIDIMTIAPDGVQREMQLINGAFPGPTIEANWGDIIQVAVHNKLKEGTTLHWHGLLQRNTSYMDGAPAIQQCPIAPGKSFTYRFVADLYGTSWYHSHYSAQYIGGLIGAMVIHGPKNYPYDVDVGPVILSDYYHTPYYTLVEQLMTPNIVTSLEASTSDNNLINGKNNFNCSLEPTTTPCDDDAGLSKFHFQPGKYHRLRLINTGAEGFQHFSIDGHILEVIAADFVPMVKSSHQVVPLAIGQRLDVIVYASGKPGDRYWMRSVIQSCSSAKTPTALAVVYYPDADETKDPTSQPWKDDLPPCNDLDPSFLAPFYPSTPLPPAEMHNLNISFGPNATGNWIWTMNGVSYRGDYNAPTLIVTKAVASTGKPFDFPSFYNVYPTNPANDTTQVVLWHLHNVFPVPHPIHFHGHNTYLLSQGVGPWDGTVTSNPNPPRRDVYILPGNGHLVFSYNATNPGVWPLHCHIAFHASTGLFIQTLEQSDWIQKYMDIPASFAQQCREWWDYTGHAVVPEIDSGL